MNFDVSFWTICFTIWYRREENDWLIRFENAKIRPIIMIPNSNDVARFKIKNREQNHFSSKWIFPTNMAETDAWQISTAQNFGKNPK